jgi:hypothetical protein
MDEINELVNAFQSTGVVPDASKVRAACVKVEALPSKLRARLWTWLLLGNLAIDDKMTFARDDRAPTGVTKNIRMDVELLLSVATVEGDATQAQEQLEGMLEYLCTKKGLPYRSALCEVVGPLVSLPAVTHGQVFHLLVTIVDSFLATQTSLAYSEAIVELLRLLLQYHDPLLSLHFDRIQVNFSVTVLQWASTLFASVFGPSHVTVLWDWLFLANDRLLPLYIGLSLLVESRDTLMKLTERDALTKAVQQLNFADSSAEKVKEFVTRARHQLKNTPMSIRRLLTDMFYAPIDGPTKLPPDDVRQRLLGFVALPIAVQEMVDTFAMAREGESRKPHLNYVILDCRAEKSFHYARLPTAVHIGGSIGYDPRLLSDMLERFENARSSHFVILGTGKKIVEEQNLLKVISLHFLQAGFVFVGIADGGFKACIPLIKSGKIEFARTPQPSDEKDGGEAAKESAGGQFMSKLRSTQLGAKLPTKEETEEALRKSKEKAAQTWGTAKQWGMGLVSSWKAKRGGTDAPQGKKVDGDRAELGSEFDTETRRGDKNKDETPPPQPLFTLDEVELSEDDQFDLITDAAAAPVPAPAATAATSGGPDGDKVAEKEQHPFDDLFV